MAGRTRSFRIARGSGGLTGRSIATGRQSRGANNQAIYNWERENAAATGGGEDTGIVAPSGSFNTLYLDETTNQLVLSGPGMEI